MTVTVIPANEASWEDVQTILGPRGEAARCQCQWFKVARPDWRETAVAERREQFRAQTSSGEPNAASTTGMVAYLDDEPAGWIAVEPRVAYPGLRTKRVPWSGRAEDPDDPGVWAVTCHVVRAGYRGRGLTYPLVEATVSFARERGATALEAYPMIVDPDRPAVWGELYVGARQVFEDAGFVQVSHPTPRRVVMRVDFS